MRRLTSLLIVIGACVAVVFMSAAGGEAEKGKKIKVAFANAFGLTEGGDMRVGGVNAGATTSFDVSKGPECQLGNPNRTPKRACAVVTLEIKEPGFESFRDDATCAIRQQSLIGEYYVDCQPGSSEKALGADEIIPDTRTASTIPADLVNNVLRRPYRDRLRLIIAELGTGLAGRPEDLSMLLHQAHPGLRATDRTLKILAGQREIIKDFISDSDTVVAQLEDKKRDVARWIRTAGRTAEISATRRAEIAAGFRRLPTFLDELRPTMARLGELTEAQRPLLAKLQASAPELTTLFERLGPFSEASRPAFRSLGELSEVGNVAFRHSRDEINTLRQLAADAPETGKPLRQFLQTLDDRDRAIDKDPRATESAPPAPDPAAANGKGFTGMEGILAYVYWQTLALNEFDSVSHFLRVLGFENDCSDYVNDARSPEMGGTEENNELRAHCNSYLGPYQPGVTHPDPTQDPNDSAEPGQSPPGKAGKGKRGARRGAGEREAPPIKGQPDYSVPNPTLPPSVQDLLNGLRGQQLPATPNLPPVGAPGTQQIDPTTALDFLLGP